MGLFDFLKGGNKKSVEYYLQQRSSRTLMKVFKNELLKFVIVGDWPERPCWVSDSRIVEETSLTRDEEGAGNNLIKKRIDIYHKGGKKGEYAHNILVDLKIRNID